MASAGLADGEGSSDCRAGEVAAGMATGKPGYWITVANRVPQRLKPRNGTAFAARLKSCPP